MASHVERPGRREKSKRLSRLLFSRPRRAVSSPRPAFGVCSAKVFQVEKPSFVDREQSDMYESAATLTPDRSHQHVDARSQPWQPGGTSVHGLYQESNLDRVSTRCSVGMQKLSTKPQ